MPEKIIHSSGTYEVVDTIPLGYTIWNIGKNAPDGYLPLCRLAANQPFPGARNIETDTLKAIKVDGATDILVAVGSGPNTPASMQKYIEQHENSKDTVVQLRVARYLKAIPIMQTIPGIENLKN